MDIVSSPVANAPLKRDAQGHVRILIVGNSGTGKSTMAVRLGQILQIPVIHLDRLHLEPGWQKKDDTLFRGEVENFLQRNKSWVIDGNYKRFVGDLIYSPATNIVWMDPPFVLYFPRLIIRTFLRLIGRAPPCSPGCNEKLSDIFTLGEKSILWWSWTHHTPNRQVFAERMRKGENDEDRMWIRLGGWGGGVKSWLERVQASVGKQ